MKKVAILFLVLGLSFILISCSKKQNFSISDNVEEVNITKNEIFGSSRVDLKFTLSGEELNDFKETMNSITYISSKVELSKYEYIISYNDININIVSNEEFYIEEGNEKKYYKVTNNDFSFLDDYDFITEYLFDVSGFDYEHVYYVHNDLNLDISLNKTFIEDFSENRLINISDENYNSFISSIKFGDKLVKFVSETVVCIDNKYYLMEDRINVEFINEDGIKNFDEIQSAEKIEVKKDSSTIEMTDKAVALNAINDLEVVELTNAFNYDLKIIYEIKIDNFILEVYSEKLVKHDNKLYYITSGNLDFLKDLKFNSTGWLPWV